MQKLRVRLSDTRFYYDCTIDNITHSSFRASGLPVLFDEKTTAPINLILTTSRTVTISVKICSITTLPENLGRVIDFQILDPPRLWREYVDFIAGCQRPGDS
jgi:hypothetical protein